MKKHWLTALLALPLLLAGGEETISFRFRPSENLVKNADFGKLNEKGLPADWTFDNCSNSPKFRTEVIGQGTERFLEVTTAWEEFGYWLQKVPLKAGATYCASCEYQVDGPSAGLWLQGETEKGHKIKSVNSVPSRFGDTLAEELRDFIPERYVFYVGPDRWSRMDKEFSLPADKGDGVCQLRIGVYGGFAGTVRMRHPAIRKAECGLDVRIAGQGWTELRIPGASPASVKLDPGAKEQTVSVVLPSICRVYGAELISQSGSKVSKEVFHE